MSPSLPYIPTLLILHQVAEARPISRSIDAGRTLIKVSKDFENKVSNAFEKYNRQKSLKLSKFPAYNAEEVLNDLQCLLQVQHHLAVLSQREDGPKTLEEMINKYDLMSIHEGEFFQPTSASCELAFLSGLPTKTFLSGLPTNNSRSRKVRGLIQTPYSAVLLLS